MKKLFILICFAIVLFAKSDFSQMSTQELVAMMEYVAPDAQKALMQELKIREVQMSVKEKKAYEENLKNLKK